MSPSTHKSDVCCAKPYTPYTFRRGVLINDVKVDVVGASFEHAYSNAERCAYLINALQHHPELLSPVPTR